MPLLDRVATLIRANLNDLIDRAEDPEKLLKQLLLDMQNQFMQLKTQTAIAIADQHLLEQKRFENAKGQAEWMQKAELALSQGDEGLARNALERALVQQTAAANFAEQLLEQTSVAASLREALSRLESKMAETRAQTDLLIARRRRARLPRQTAQRNPGHDLERLRNKVLESEALAYGFAAVAGDDASSQLERMAKNEKVETLLQDLKRKRLTGGTG